jgi:hypothetical protein
MSGELQGTHQWDATMEGAGIYDRHSYIQSHRGMAGLPLIEQAARLIDLGPNDQPILITDYGSSLGRNSLAPLGAAIAVLRERCGPERAICVTHTDLPDNDFSSLFHTVFGDPDSYLRSDPNVFPSAIGRSFYEGVQPPSQVSLGWCASAAHWPSCIASRVTGHFWSICATGSEKSALESQCGKDWRLFLALRARELRPNGRLVVVQPSLDEQGYMGHEPLANIANDSLAELVSTGVIRAAERSSMIVVGCGRDRSRLLEPFAETGSFAGPAVEHCEVFRMPDAAWEAYRQNADKEKLAVQRARWFRAALVPTLASQLDSDRSPADRHSFAEMLEATLTRRLADSLVPMPIMSATIVMVRDESPCTDLHSG